MDIASSLCMNTFLKLVFGCFVVVVCFYFVLFWVFYFFIFFGINFTYVPSQIYGSDSFG